MLDYSSGIRGFHDEADVDVGSICRVAGQNAQDFDAIGKRLSQNAVDSGNGGSEWAVVVRTTIACASQDSRREMQPGEELPLSCIRRTPLTDLPHCMIESRRRYIERCQQTRPERFLFSMSELLERVLGIVSDLHEI